MSNNEKEDKVPGFNIDTFVALTRLIRAHREQLDPEDLDHLKRFREHLEGYFTHEELEAEGLAPLVGCAYGAPFRDEPLLDEDVYWDVCLEKTGKERFRVLKEIRWGLGLTLQEAKNALDRTPIVLKYGIDYDEALKFQETFQALGATVTLTRSK